MRFVAGARHACLGCLWRGVRSRCPRCGDDFSVADLATPEGRRRFALRRATGLVTPQGLGLLDTSVLARYPLPRRILWFAMRGAFVAGWSVTNLMPLQNVSPVLGPLEIFTRFLLGIIVGVVAAGAVVLLTIAAAGLLVSGAVLVARLTGSMPEPDAPGAPALLERVDQSPQGVFARSLVGVERAFFPQMRLELPECPDPGTRVEGAWVFAATDACAHLWLDLRGEIALADAEIPPFELRRRAGTPPLRFDPACAVVEIDDTLARARGCPGGDREDRIPWADTEAEHRARLRVVDLPAGTRVEVRGGVDEVEPDLHGGAAGFRDAAVREVRRGTPDRPLCIRVLEIPGPLAR